MTHRLLLILLLLAISIALAANPVKEKIDRLFLQASSGEIRYRDVVQPSNDSLIAMGDSAAKYLALKLNTTDARERHTLVDIYRGIGKTATPYLLEALKTDDKEQLRTTCRALGDVKDTAAIDNLAEIAEHDDYTVRAYAIEAIGKTGGGERTAMIVTPYLHDQIFSPRKSAAAALGRIQVKESIPHLIEALSDDHFAVRLVAYNSLVRYDTLAHQAIVRHIIEAPDKRTRALAVRLSGDLRIPEAKQFIEPMMAYEDSLLRGWAIWALGRIEGKDTHLALEEMLRWEEDLFVRSLLQETIEYRDTLSVE